MEALRELVIELTGLCPLRCLHCSSNSGPDSHDSLRRATVMRLVQEAASLGAEQVSFGGGEPSCSPLLPEVLPRVESLNLRSEVFTCGVCIHRHGFGSLPQKLVARLARIKRLKMIFSLHGAKAEVHDLITDTEGSFECTMASLRACTKAGILCELNFVPLRPTVRELEGMVGLASRHGVKKVSILRFVPQGRGFENSAILQLTRDEEADFVSDLLRVRAESPVEVRTGSPFNGIIPGNCVPCRAGAAKLVVQPDGNVLPCEVFKDPSRRDWALAVDHCSMCELLAAPRLQSLRGRLERTSLLRCPVHAAASGDNVADPDHAFSEYTIHV